MKKIRFLSLILMMALVLTGCGKDKTRYIDGKGTSLQSECPSDKCVYSSYHNSDIYFKSDNVDNDKKTLKNYVKDYKELTYEDKDDNKVKQSRVFMAYILDKKEQVEKAFVCGIVYNVNDGEKVMCFEGGNINDEKSYETAKSNLIAKLGTKSDDSYYGCYIDNDYGEDYLNCAVQTDEYNDYIHFLLYKNGNINVSTYRRDGELCFITSKEIGHYMGCMINR